MFIFREDRSFSVVIVSRLIRGSHQQVNVGIADVFGIQPQHPGSLLQHGVVPLLLRSNDERLQFFPPGVEMRCLRPIFLPDPPEKLFVELFGRNPEILLDYL